MALIGDLVQAQSEMADRLAGRSTSQYGLVAYTPEAERSIKSLPSITTYRSVLQNNDGTLKLKPADDGTFTSGRYYIDSWGRYISY